MRSLLCYNGYASGGAKAYTLSPFSFTQLGNNIGTVDTGTPAVTNMRSGLIVQYQNTIYVLHQRTVKKLESDGSWSTVVSLTGTNTNDTFNQMILCNIGGDYFLACIYASTSSDGTNTYIRGGTYNLQTGVLTTSSEVVLSTGGGAASAPTLQRMVGAIFYNGTVYTAGAGTTGAGGIIAYNVASPGITNTPAPLPYGNPHVDFAIWNNELWAVMHTTGSTGLVLYKLVGTSWVLQATLATTTWSTGNAKPCLFTDGTDLFALGLTNAQVWNLYRIQSNLTITNITASVIPGFTAQDLDSRWRVVVDQHQSPTNPEIILIYQGDTGGGSNSFYRWNGIASQLTFIGAAGSADFKIAIATPKSGGGEMMFTEGEPHIQIEGPLASTSTPGNTRISYRIYESSLFPSGTPVQVKMFFNEEQEPAINPCRLVNPLPSGNMVDIYTVDGIVAGSGQLYTIDWRASADGIGEGAGAFLMAQVSGVLS